MNMHTINETPFHAGGRFGPGQEIFYAAHRIRLWKFYCNRLAIPFSTRDSNLVYKQKKEILQRLCEMLGISSEGTKNNLIAKLDRHTFTQEDIDIIGF
jgi:hypothetical protein